MSIPIALLVDDAAPVNTMFWHDSPYEHAFAVPNTLARDFADLCDEYGVRGKFSVLPMPCGLGGIDGQLSHVPPRDLQEFLTIVRARVAPRFDITPEILTHLNAYRLSGGFHHVYEDEWVAHASMRELTDYIALALRILDYVGLPANGVTSPWMAGEHNEAHYAEAIGRAQWRVHRRAVTWYFLRMYTRGPAHGPSIAWRNPRTGQTVVSIPATTGDAFWDTQRPMAPTFRAARGAAAAGVDRLLSANGTTGRIRALMRQRCPILILTHWQSLFSDGSCAGLWALERLFARIRKNIAHEVDWVTCSALAARTAEMQT
jgi:hypothetical protein